MCVCVCLGQGKMSKTHPCPMTSLGLEKSADGKASQVGWDVFVIPNAIIY